MTKKDIQDPVQCDVELCCKATGEVKVQVVEDLQKPDRSLAELLEKRDDEDTDTESE